MSVSVTDVAAYAEVAPPSSPTSPGALYLLTVVQADTADLADIGPGLHLACLDLAADLAVPLGEVDAWAAFVDLELFTEGLTTEDAVEAVGRRLGLALLRATLDPVPVPA